MNEMIIYTNEGNPLGLKLLSTAKFAKKDVEVKIVTLNNCKLDFYRFVVHRKKISVAFRTSFNEVADVSDPFSLKISGYPIEVKVADSCT